MAHSEVSARIQGSLGILDADRNFDLSSYESAFRAMEQFVEGRVSQIAFNFTATEYLNSRGIHLMIMLVEIAREAGLTLYAYGLNAHQKRLLSMVGLASAITLAENEQEVLDAQ